MKVNDGPCQGDVLGERKKNFLSFLGRVACQTLVGDFYLTWPGYLPFAMHYKVEIGRTKDTIVAADNITLLLNHIHSVCVCVCVCVLLDTCV